jgi:hypothetical protein
MHIIVPLREMGTTPAKQQNAERAESESSDEDYYPVFINKPCRDEENRQSRAQLAPDSEKQVAQVSACPRGRCRRGQGEIWKQLRGQTQSSMTLPPTFSPAEMAKRHSNL